MMTPVDLQPNGTFFVETLQDGFVNRAPICPDDAVEGYPAHIVEFATTARTASRLAVWKAQQDSLRESIRLRANVPDYIGFLHWLNANLSFAQVQAFHQHYGMFIAWCQFGNAPRVQEAILDAKLNHPELMTPAVYALFQQAAQTYHLPVVLP